MSRNEVVNKRCEQLPVRDSYIKEPSFFTITF